jgi:hypothetical protein
VFAVFVVGAVSAVSASAEECLPLLQVNHWCFAVGPELLLTETEEFSSSKDTETLSKLAIVGALTIECDLAHDLGIFLESETEPQIDKLVIVFLTSCLVEGEETKCEVKEPITTNAIVGELLLTNDILFKPETGTEFATFTLKSKPPETCLFASTFHLTGEQLCEDSHLEEDLVTHLIYCSTEGSSLLGLGKEALFELDETFALEGPNKGQAFGWFHEMF